MKDTIRHNGIIYEFDTAGGYIVEMCHNGIFIHWAQSYWKAYCKGCEVEIKDKFTRKECDSYLKFLKRLEAGR